LVGQAIPEAEAITCWLILVTFVAARLAFQYYSASLRSDRNHTRT
jgi:hypothetical protein